MKRTITAGVIAAALAFSAAAQDWYHDRDERFRGEEWRAHVFKHVRTGAIRVSGGTSASSPYWAGVRVRLRTGISPEVMALPALFKRDNVFYRVRKVKQEEAVDRALDRSDCLLKPSVADFCTRLNCDEFTLVTFRNWSLFSAAWRTPHGSPHYSARLLNFCGK